MSAYNITEPAPFPVQFRRGCTYRLILTFIDTDSGDPVDMTDWAAEWRGQDGGGVELFDLSSTGVSPRITLGGEDGTLTAEITYAETEAMEVGYGGLHALRLTDSLEGRFDYLVGPLSVVQGAFP